MRTFVLRIRRGSNRDGEPERLRGVVDDLRTGTRTTFTSEAELLHALDEPDPGVDPSQEDS